MTKKLFETDKYYKTINILDQVLVERSRQVDRLGYDAKHDDAYSIHVLPTLAAEHINQNPCDSGYRTELIQAIALLVAAVEKIDRKLGNDLP